MVPLFVAAELLASNRTPIAFLNERLFPWAPWQFWMAALVTALGLLFTVWARVYLGRNWSGVVTIKQDHELIDTGPYSLVRHPSMQAARRLHRLGVGSGRVARRARRAHRVGRALAEAVEERWLTEHFGQRYVDYCRRVPALMPLWKRRRT
jgi:protein-S-isoprenylcysteine O-methyltransferase Ste14